MERIPDRPEEWEPGSSPTGADEFDRLPIFGGVNVHVEPAEQPGGITRLTEFMCRCGPREWEGSGYEEKLRQYKDSDGNDRYKWVKGRKKFKPSDGQVRCDEVLAEVKERLGADDSNLLDKVIFSLNWEFEAHVTGIENDQWSGVAAETYEPKFRTYVECDRVEDGIAMTWKLFADNLQREES